MSDEITKPERFPPPVKRLDLDKLEEYAEQFRARGDEKTANDTLVLQHLVTALRANAERDLLMAQMASRIDVLERSSALYGDAFAYVVQDFRALQRAQQEDHARLDMIVATVDAAFEEISKAVRQLGALSSSVKDVTEP